MAVVRFALVVLLWCGTTYGQSLIVQTSKPQQTVSAEDLSIPFYAGADYALTIDLKTTSTISVFGVPPEIEWCLFARRPNWAPNESQIKLTPDISTFHTSPSGGIDKSLTPASLDTGIEMLPVLSGYGEVKSVLIDWSLTGASVLIDYGLQDKSIQWRLINRGCPP
jgi:hypothetical protein